MADPGEVQPRDVSSTALPSLAPLPPPFQSPAEAPQTLKTNKPVGKVQPFNLDSIDPSELNLNPLPPPPPPPPSLPPLKHTPEEGYTDKHSTSSSGSPPDDSLTIHNHFPSPAPPTFDPTHLPRHKSIHLFISHSTSDAQLVKESLVVVLRESGRSVSACYHFMPDSTRYNDHEIKNSMKSSCVVAIGLSQAYLLSDRCRREYEYALKLYSNKDISNILVLAFGTCSRPPVLKRFLYLDFIVAAKRSSVWTKMVESIDKAVAVANEQYPRAEGPKERESPRSGGRSPAPSEGSSPEETMEYQEYQGAFEFEDALLYMKEKGEVTSDDEDKYGHYKIKDDEVGGAEERSDNEEYTSDTLHDQTREGEWETETGSEDDKVGGDTEGEGVATEEVGVATGKRKRTSSDIEDGEVSDSSSEDLNPQAQKMMKKDIDQSDCEDEEGLEQSEKVQRFYDQLAAPGADRRDESPIIYMRGFNNWVKSVLIRTYLPPSATVLDLCCGKGGDLNKWKEGNIHYLVGADISETSIENCVGRYKSNKLMDRRTKKPAFEAEFIVADCCQVRLQDEYINPARRFHVTSCQFSLHYAFESFEKATMMLRNACENLRPGGYFIGTTVDANELISRLRDRGTQDESGCWSISNDVYSVSLDREFNPHNTETPLPLFGCKYHFQLAGVVNVPEFLLHYPLLVEMLREWDMVEVRHQNFYDFFSEHRHIPDDASLLFRMQAFDKRTGTMSAPEWEAIGLYLIFVFQKRGPQQ